MKIMIVLTLGVGTVQFRRVRSTHHYHWFVERTLSDYFRFTLPNLLCLFQNLLLQKKSLNAK